MPIKKKNAIEEYEEYYNGMNKQEKINFALGIFAVIAIAKELYMKLKKKDVK